MPPPPAVTGDEVHLSSDENCKSCGHRSPRWSLSGSGCCPHCGTRDLTLRPEAQ
jgi:Zn finger protein HypA/HybF involved in hydrogenase expression